MEKCQLVLELHPRLPMLFMVGDPDRQAVDDAVGRVMMLAAMREAPLVVVDVSDLMYAEEVVPQAAEVLSEHSRAASVRVLLSGAAPAVREAVRERHGQALTVYDTVNEAMREATAALGVPWPDA
jgi:nucleotide-binding universal stress UspA family protein